MRVLVCLALVAAACALQNGLALTPQMGWNSWNHFACNVNESIIRATADAFVSRGLAAAGYQYVNVDDCWAYSRNASGVVQADPTTFPSGMAALAAYVHKKGLKFGLYSDAGNETCAGRPGSLGYETIDARTYASWAVDYLKYDNCYATTPPQTRYPVMRDALNATRRSIFFSMCEWGVNNPATWAPAVGNSWRTTGDIKDVWLSVMSNLYQNDAWAKYAAPGGWNDPDMLEIGNGGLSSTEEVSHFSLWCLIKAPLLIGCDVTSVDNDTIALLTNPEAIAVSQDKLGVQGSKRVVSGSTEVWVAPMSDGSVAAVYFNTGEFFHADITATWADLGLSVNATATVRDINNHADLGSFSGAYTAKRVPAHGVAFLRFYPESQ